MTATPTDDRAARRADRIARLPKWARDDLANWERRALSAEAEVEAHRLGTYGDLDTDTVADPYGQALHLPKGETVTFTLDGNASAFHNGVRVRVSDGVLRINGDRGLAISPVASNDVQIRLAND